MTGPARPRWFLGLDLGTTFVKGAVLDLEACRLRAVHRLPFPGPLPGRPPTWSEADPGAVLDVARAMLERLAAAEPRAEGLVLCSQMHGLVLTDAAGRPLSPAITWLDRRALDPHPSGAGSCLDALAREVGQADARRLGEGVRAGLPLGALFAMAATGRLPGPGAVPASLGDFVAARLCGVPPRTDPTAAGAHGALDIETGDWHRPLLARLGLSGLAWPPIRPPGDPLGECRVRGARLRVHVPVGDQQCALLGAWLEPGELSVNVATGSQVALVGSRAETGPFQTRPYLDGLWLRTVTHIPAGRALNALVRLLGELGAAHGQAVPDPWPYLVRAAEAAGPTDLRVSLAFYPGALGDRGAIEGLREETLTVGHLFRAAFESMAEAYAACAARLDPARGWRGVALSGGLVRRVPLLRRLVAERLGGPVRLSASAEDTLLGLLALGLVASGRAVTTADAVAALRERFREDEAGPDAPAG
jgi:sugar (pentulose or hexulose) kinase